MTPAEEKEHRARRTARASDLERLMNDDRTLSRLDWFKQGLADRDLVALAAALGTNKCCQQLYLW